MTRMLINMVVGVLFLYQCYIAFERHVSYPTSTTTQKRAMKDQTLHPFFVLCPEVGVDIKKLQDDKGYHTMAEFYMGRMTNGKRGWGGLKNESFLKIMNDIKKINDKR